MTEPPRVYADFNACLDLGGDDRPGLVHLERLGTLRDLCAARLRLCEGMRLLLHSDSSAEEDLEVEATARWLWSSRAFGEGSWVGEFDPVAFREVPAQRGKSVKEWFPCARCGTNLKGQIEQHGLDRGSRCVACAARVHSPLDPPEEDRRVLDLVEQAFRGVALGSGVSLRETLVLDDYGDESARRAARALDEAEDWRKVVFEPELTRLAFVGGLPFYDPEGMRFHLPAYLALAVIAFERDDAQNVLECLVHALTNLEPTSLKRFALLDVEQRRCVGEVLRFLRERYELESSALDQAVEWWGG
jgi:hypothetical protein